jgi:hypothetical protein
MCTTSILSLFFTASVLATPVARSDAAPVALPEANHVAKAAAARPTVKLCVANRC